MNKKRKWSIIAILVLLMLIKIPVHATGTEGNGTGEGSGTGTMRIEGGPKSTHTGWLVYVVNENLEQTTETKVYYSGSDRPSNNYLFFSRTRFGGKVPAYYVSDGICPWQPKAPFTQEGDGNGSKIKTYMHNNNYIKTFIASEFGDDVLKKFESERCYLILEPFFWGQMYNGKTATGRYLCATAYGWAEFQERFGYGEYGSAYINRYTNNTYPNCVKLEYQQFGLQPLRGKLTNQQIMASGNGFMAFWFVGENQQENDPTQDIGKQLYAIQNWSDEFDISKSIPSGEPINNRFEADSFYGECEIIEKTMGKNYNCTYTYEYVEKYKKSDGTYGKRTIRKPRTISFRAQLKAQNVQSISVNVFEEITVFNKAFPDGRIIYNRDNTDTWYDVTVDTILYDDNDLLLSPTVAKNIVISEESHFQFADDLKDKTVHVSGPGAISAQFEKDKVALMKQVYEGCASRNDRIIIRLADKEGNPVIDYTFMEDTPVRGCIIPGIYNSSAAASSYRYGGAGIELHSVQPARNKGKMTVMIPPSTDNNDYPTGIECRYQNLAIMQ